MPYNVNLTIEQGTHVSRVIGKRQISMGSEQPTIMVLLRYNKKQTESTIHATIVNRVSEFERATFAISPTLAK